MPEECHPGCVICMGSTENAYRQHTLDPDCWCLRDRTGQIMGAKCAEARFVEDQKWMNWMP